MKLTNIIAIDCGASFLKAALFYDGKIIREKYSRAPKVHGEEDIFFPGQISALVCEVKKILEELTENLSEAFVCISNEMHGFILANKNGLPFTDYISWQKEYGSNVIEGISSKEILNSKEYASDILYTGMPVRSGLPSSNLLFLKRTKALNHSDDELYFYTLGDYIIREITGKQPVIHITNAAASGLTNLKKCCWNSRLIELVCGNRIVFPEIGVKSIESEIKGCILHFLPSIGDQQAALYGSGLNSDNQLSFNIGTGAQVSKITDLCFSEHFQTRPYMNGKFIKSIAHLPAGRALNVYIRFIQDILYNFDISADESSIWKKVIETADKYEKSSLKCDLSFFGNPVSDNITGSIGNISEYDLNMGNLFKSIFDTLSENLIWAASVIEPENDNVKKIIFSGGISKKIDFIRTRISEYYSKAKIVLSPDKETLYGLAYYAMDSINKGLI